MTDFDDVLRRANARLNNTPMYDCKVCGKKVGTFNIRNHIVSDMRGHITGINVCISCDTPRCLRCERLPSFIPQDTSTYILTENGKIVYPICTYCFTVAEKKKAMDEATAAYKKACAERDDRSR